MSANTNVKEMVDLIGTTVRVKVEGFYVPMTISDVKIAYGNKRLLVSPVGGEGESWIDSSRVTTLTEPPRTQPKSQPEKVNRKSNAEEVPSEAGKIRAWARSRGIHVNERGRIPTPVIDQYHKETLAAA